MTSCLKWQNFVLQINRRPLDVNVGRLVGNTELDTILDWSGVKTNSIPFSWDNLFHALIFAINFCPIYLYPFLGPIAIFTGLSFGQEAETLFRILHQST